MRAREARASTNRSEASKRCWFGLRACILARSISLGPGALESGWIVTRTSKPLLRSLTDQSMYDDGSRPRTNACLRSLEGEPGTPLFSWGDSERPSQTSFSSYQRDRSFIISLRENRSHIVSIRSITVASLQNRNDGLGYAGHEWNFRSILIARLHLARLPPPVRRRFVARDQELGGNMVAPSCSHVYPRRTTWLKVTTSVLDASFWPLPRWCLSAPSSVDPGDLDLHATCGASRYPWRFLTTMWRPAHTHTCP